MRGTRSMSRIGQDYIWNDQRRWQLPRLRWVALACTLPLVAGAIGMTTQHAGGSAAAAQTGDATGIDTPLAAAAGMNMAPLAETPVVSLDTASAGPPHNNEPLLTDAPATAATQADKTAGPRWIDIEIQRGDTLSLAFERHELSYRDSLAIAHLDEYGRHFTRGLKAGDQLRVRAEDSGNILAVDYPLDAIRTLKVRETDNGYSAKIVHADVERRKAYAVGSINDSFYVDALEAGLSDKLVMNLAHIFGWDIDFVHDIQKGDHFIVVYEQLYRDGQKIRDGHILAAEFTNRGEELRALRYTDDDGESAYYAPNGDAMKKAFIRTPLDQFRISSHFSAGRKHPVLNRIRKHEGTDFAAPTGTPIKATGDGRIVFRGRKGGYGNTIYIKHNGRYSTRYAHMSRFASGQSVGTYVEQGETIGYVGMSGLATGPHLHYEFRVNGAPRNPETVDLPGAPPLSDERMADFRDQTQPLMAQIDALDRIQLAKNEVTE